MPALLFHFLPYLVPSRFAYWHLAGSACFKLKVVAPPGMSEPEEGVSPGQAKGVVSYDGSSWWSCREDVEMTARDLESPVN